MKGEGDPNLLDDAVVKEIAAKHECTPAQVSSHDSLSVLFTVFIIHRP